MGNDITSQIFYKGHCNSYVMPSRQETLNAGEDHSRGRDKLTGKKMISLELKQTDRPILAEGTCCL